jgi:aryl-alcohol dehydrogenase
VRVKAAVLREPRGRYTFQDVALDEPREDEILVRVAGAGMCHTDMLPRIVPAGAISLPLILGHEGAGTVEAVGRNVSVVEVGDAVVLSFDQCGTCPSCRRGEPAYCYEFARLNTVGTRLDDTHGAVSADGEPIGARWFGQSTFATHALATERNVVKLPDDDLPLHLMGPLGCGVQTGAGSVLIAMGVGVGESIAVFGVGAVGLSAVMAAKLAGAGQIIGVDLHPRRRELALELGATRVFDGSDPDVAARIGDVTGGGVNYSFETTGVPSVINAAIDSLQIRGFCGLVGVGTADVTLSPQALSHGRIVSYLLEGSVVPQLFIPQLVELWRRGRFPFDQLIRTYPLTQANEAETDSLAGRTVKPVLLPTPV